MGAGIWALNINVHVSRSSHSISELAPFFIHRRAKCWASECILVQQCRILEHCQYAEGGVWRGRGVGRRSNARYVRLRPSLIWAMPPPVRFKSSSQLKAVICNIWIDLSLKLLTPFEDFLLLYFVPWSRFQHLSLNICKMCVCFCTMIMTWHWKTWKSSLSQKYICLKLNVILRFCFAWICTDGNK